MKHSLVKNWKVLLLASCGCVLALMLSGCDAGHKGRSMESWLTDLGNFNKDKRAQASEAIRSIGTNGLPALVKILNPQSQADVTLRRQAVKAFEILGPTGAAAVPELESLLRNPAVTRDAAAALAAIGKAGLPSLIKALDDSQPTVRTGAAVALASLANDALSAVPGLVKLLSDDFKDVRSAAIVAVGSIQGEPDAVVPALIANLNHPDQDIRIGAIHSLAKYGPAAKAALPELLKAAKSRSEYLRDAALGALPLIDSEASKQTGQ